MKTVVSEKGQVTIPKRLRERLGLEPGTAIEFEESDGRLVGRKLVPQNHLDELLGIMKLPVSVDEFIEELRGPAPGGLTRHRKRPDGS
jgi:AbrB family looped-hinge helix DNA binding protein